jgi:hypothetical protein
MKYQSKTLRSSNLLPTQDLFSGFTSFVRRSDSELSLYPSQTTQKLILNVSQAIWNPYCDCSLQQISKLDGSSLPVSNPSPS